MRRDRAPFPPAAAGSRAAARRPAVPPAGVGRAAAGVGAADHRRLPPGRAVTGREPDRCGPWPWGTAAATTAAAAGTWGAAGPGWWAHLVVPRAPHPSDVLRPGVAVPVTGPGGRDADGDGRADTLVVEGPGGFVLWSDLDGDGLADRVTVVAPEPVPAEAGLVAALLHRLAGP